MSWIGINPFPPGYASRKARPNLAFDPSGTNGRFPDQDMLLVQGTVMFEVEVPVAADRRQPLVSFRSNAGWHRQFTVECDASPAIHLTLAQGGTPVGATLSSAEFLPGARLRISYSWDAPARVAHLTVQSLDRFSIHQATVPDPVPLPLEDLRGIVSIGPATIVEDGIICLAIADHVAPICLSSGLMRGNLVGTTEGYRPVERLALGDLVATVQGDPKPIRWITRTDLPAVGHFSPIRLRAPFFGLIEDIVIAQSQSLLMTGADAEYLFGADMVLVRAQDLTNLHSVHYEPDLPVVTYYQILLDDHDCIDVGGTWTESLYISQLAGAPGIVAASNLSALPAAALPRHSQTFARSLRSYEAATLLTEMIA